MPPNKPLQPIARSRAPAERRALGDKTMSDKSSYPREWLEKVPAVVFASLVRGECRLLLHPGSGFASGGAEYDAPIEKIPMDLRMPNSKVWVELDEKMNVVRVWRREE